MLNDLFGPSIRLQVLDLFLEHPNDMMNLREIARRIEKNPGSVSRVMHRLVNQEFLTQSKIGKVTHAYKLNTEGQIVSLIIELNYKLKLVDAD